MIILAGYLWQHNYLPSRNHVMNISDLQNKIDIPYERDKELEHNVKVLLSLYRKVNFRVEERIQALELETYESKRKRLEDLVISILEIDTNMELK